MLKTALRHFNELRPPVRAMVYLHWVYGFVGAMTSVFVQIFLYQRFSSVSFNIVALAVYFIGCALGFSLVGALMAWWRINMKWGYLWAFVILCLSFLFLYGEVEKNDALLFSFFNGFGLGLYWVTLHTFELTETKNHERDYYSSVLSAGDQIIDLAAPAFATLLFFLSKDIFHLGSYTLLFAVSPLLYLAGIPLFRHIRTYRPSPIDRADVRHFLHDRKNRTAQLYLFAGSANFAFGRIVLPVAAIMFLGSETHVGLFNTVFAVISAIALIALSHYRHSGNRLRFLFVTAMATAGITLLFAARFDLIIFILFSLCSVVLKPLLRVSSHVIDLETMETLGIKGRDFFPTMILRDAAFGVWRVLALLLLLGLTSLVGEGENAVRLGLLFLAIATVLLYTGATLLYQKK